MWGPEGWKKVVVCIVSDGRNKVNKRTLQVLSLVRFQSQLSSSASVYHITDGMLSRGHCKRLCRRKRRYCTYFRVCSLIRYQAIYLTIIQIHLKRDRYRFRRGIARFMSCSNSFLPQGAKQEKVEQPSMVLQRFRPLAETKRSVRSNGPQVLNITYHQLFFSSSLYSP